MHPLRRALGLLVGAFALSIAVQLTLGGGPQALPIRPPGLERLAALTAGPPLWRSAFWIAMSLLLSLSAWRLLTRGRAFRLYAAAILINLMLWMVERRSGAPPPDPSTAQMAMLAAEMLVGAAIAYADRGRT